MLKKLRSGISYGAIFLLAPFATLLFTGIAHAGPLDTWTGTDCISATSCDWSDANNWSAGAPISGVDLQFDNSILGSATGAPIDDIAGLSVGTITFINNDSGSGESIQLLQGLTVTTAITQDSTDTTTPDDIGNSGGAGQIITLGGNVIVSTSNVLTIGDTGDSIDLATNTLTLTQINGPSTSSLVVDAAITGSGTVVYNSATTDFQIGASNTYSGSTDVLASKAWVGNTNDNDNPFGSSSITVANAGAIQFNDTVNTTISNPITITGTVSGSNITSMDFTCGSGCSGATIITIPNITLNGNTRLSAGDTDLAINLAGITSNGFCIEYIQTGTQFAGGPADCTVLTSGSGGSGGSGSTSTTTPKTPDTGSTLLKSNVVWPFIVTSLIAAVIFFIARKINKPTIVKR